VAQENETLSKTERFVQNVLEKLQGPDTSFGAMLRRADDPVAGYLSWPYLCRWCNIELSWEYKPYALIGAALAKAKPGRNGNMGIGQALVLCYSSEGTFDGAEQDAAQKKIRRLLACTSGEEACGILRPLLRLINSRETSRPVELDYAALLRDLLSRPETFNRRVRAQWARDFYYKKEEE
jgi:CRISPR system Cascade subunit CasB